MSIKKSTAKCTEYRGAIHLTKISGNLGPKLNGSVWFNRKSYEKTGPPFEVDHFSPGRTGWNLGWMDRAPRTKLKPQIVKTWPECLLCFELLYASSWPQNLWFHRLFPLLRKVTVRETLWAQFDCPASRSVLTRSTNSIYRIDSLTN